jgi:phosphoribosylamine-glycine ligase
MNALKKCAKPSCVYPVIVLLLVSTWYQSASAAMIGTERLLPAVRGQETRDYLNQVMARQEVRNALIAQGIDPQEAELRLASLTDEEITLIAHKVDDLTAGRGVVIFSLIIVAVIVAAFIIFNYTSVTDVFP